MKGNTLLKKKTKGIKKEEEACNEMNEIVTVIETYQMTEIVWRTHQYLQRKKCPSMNVTKDFLPCRQQQKQEINNGQKTFF